MKVDGYMVIETCEDYEQPLGLNREAGLPDGGLLIWTAAPRAIFDSRKTAQAAIDRTDHYRQAFGSTDLPERKLCKIVGVCRV